MIVGKTTKDYVERMDLPNTNWAGEDYYLVDSNSELAEKIRENHPYFEFVLDDDGSLIDITPTERPEQPEDELMTLEELNAVVNALLRGEG